jgi:SNF2 family DNA or RNA helicase
VVLVVVIADDSLGLGYQWYELETAQTRTCCFNHALLDSLAASITCDIPPACIKRLGVRWLYSQYRQNKGAVLGDDMGLGQQMNKRTNEQTNKHNRASERTIDQPSNQATKQPSHQTNKKRS